MDIQVLQENFVLLSVVAGFLVGWVIKNTELFNKIANEWIPFIVTFIGALTSIAVNGNSVENIIWGAVSGMISVFAYEAIHNAIKLMVGKTGE